MKKFFFGMAIVIAAAIAVAINWIPTGIYCTPSACINVVRDEDIVSSNLEYNNDLSDSFLRVIKY